MKVVFTAKYPVLDFPSKIRRIYFVSTCISWCIGRSQLTKFWLFWWLIWLVTLCDKYLIDDVDWFDFSMDLIVSIYLYIFRFMSVRVIVYRKKRKQFKPRVPQKEINQTNRFHLEFGWFLCLCTMSTHKQEWSSTFICRKVFGNGMNICRRLHSYIRLCMSANQTDIFIYTRIEPCVNRIDWNEWRKNEKREKERETKNSTHTLRFFVHTSKEAFLVFFFFFLLRVSWWRPNHGQWNEWATTKATTTNCVCWL